MYGATTLDDAEQYQAKQRGEDAELNGRGATRIARKSGAEQHRRGADPTHPVQLGCGAHQLYGSFLKAVAAWIIVGPLVVENFMKLKLSASGHL